MKTLLDIGEEWLEAASVDAWSKLANAAIEAVVTAQPPSLYQPLRARGEVSLVLGDDDFLQMLNKQWRGKDKPTNVLSFPAIEPEMIAAVGAGSESGAAGAQSEGAPSSGEPSAAESALGLALGDIAIAFETASSEAELLGIPLEQHCAHLIVHGMYHLLGHDHKDDAMADEMEAMEAKSLASMGIDNPYRAAR